MSIDTTTIDQEYISGLQLLRAANTVDYIQHVIGIYLQHFVPRAHRMARPELLARCDAERYANERGSRFRVESIERFEESTLAQDLCKATVNDARFARQQ